MTTIHSMLTGKHPILIADGTFKNVENIQVNDKVMDINLKPKIISHIIQGKRNDNSSKGN